MAYATVEDFTAFLDPDPVPVNAARLLDRASEVLDEVLIGARYATDTDGKPTDAATIALFRKAVCIQAQYRMALDDETGANANVNQMRVGNVHVMRALQNGGDATPQVSAQMIRVLRTAGALPTYPVIWG